jgi:hypothetical protein
MLTAGTALQREALGWRWGPNARHGGDHHQTRQRVAGQRYRDFYEARPIRRLLTDSGPSLGRALALGRWSYGIYLFNMPLLGGLGPSHWDYLACAASHAGPNPEHSGNLARRRSQLSPDRKAVDPHRPTRGRASKPCHSDVPTAAGPKSDAMTDDDIEELRRKLLDAHDSRSPRVNPPGPYAALAASGNGDRSRSKTILSAKLCGVSGYWPRLLLDR